MRVELRLPRLSPASSDFGWAEPADQLWQSSAPSVVCSRVPRLPLRWDGLSRVRPLGPPLSGAPLRFPALARSPLRLDPLRLDPFRAPLALRGSQQKSQPV